MKINKEEFNEIISEVFSFPKDKITDEMGPDNIEKWDSVGQLSLISTIESRCEINFEIEEIFEIFSVGDIKKILIKKGVYIN